MANKKLKLLYLARFLQEETDEQHPKTLQDMLSYLAAHGITAERKSVYYDLELLSLYGMDVQSVRGKTYGYFLGQRDFQLPELKLLMDAVQSSRFITQKKSDALIRKLRELEPEFIDFVLEALSRREGGAYVTADSRLY